MEIEPKGCKDVAEPGPVVSGAARTGQEHGKDKETVAGAGEERPPMCGTNGMAVPNASRRIRDTPASDPAERCGARLFTCNGRRGSHYNTVQVLTRRVKREFRRVRSAKVRVVDGGKA